MLMSTSYRSKLDPTIPNLTYFELKAIPIPILEKNGIITSLSRTVSEERLTYLILARFLFVCPDNGSDTSTGRAIKKSKLRVG